ncbi:hypothetical protein [Massilia sp. CFBP9026]|uniref:hypothetical protein n=1 Tax=Massilia sp. CFBP9026 TaxID=3096536 RepID=UPI002A6AEA77|nr:hypothetical protein [Massilia sp. CFBP9026]MDY0962746.1 hypothetical protein [Massilia sp. CFBP9026]
MPDSDQPAIDRLDRLRKPLVTRSVFLIVSVCLLLVGLHAWSLLASRQAEIDNTGTSTANMARALASHAERTIDLGDAILDEMTARAEAGTTVSDEDSVLHARLAHIASVRPGSRNCSSMTSMANGWPPRCPPGFRAAWRTASTSATTGSTRTAAPGSVSRSAVVRLAS